jgi:aspartyl-tRNA(Asn)/glutamyl-tRNA(Gln) amidotransferase subunit B
MYIPTIGLEIHVELKTRTKMFCGCLNNPQERTPNIHVCPICLGHPGALPVPNRAAIEEVLKLGLAVGGKIARRSHFDRKSYFYPDLPKGYQISQFDEPFVENGILEGVRITRVHLEEDAGRLSHENSGKDSGESASLVDFNRAGMPLMELVTEPDIHTAEEAVRFAKALQQLMRYLGASDADMEHGQMRVEVNISLSKDKNNGEEKKLGTKVEVKNINSFKAVSGAIEYEIERQTELLERGEVIIHETRGWNDEKKKTESQRSKELSHDYRYFPEPDIPPMTFDEEEILALTAGLPELPEQKRMRFTREFNLSDAQVGTITDELFWANYFEQAASELGARVREADYSLLLNYVSSDVWGMMKRAGIKNEALKVTPKNLAGLAALIQEGKCSSRIAKDVLAKMFASGDDAQEIMEAGGIALVSDDETLLVIIHEVIERNPKVVADFKGGKSAALQFLVGQGMAKTRGQADPAKLRELFERELQ